MKLFHIALLSLITLFSCNNSGNKTNTFRHQSVGAINSLQVVISDELWDDNVGAEVRNYFTVPADGLPQEEPLFSLNQISPNNFKGFLKNNRLFLHLTISDKDSVKIAKDPFARPQTGAILTATTKEGLIDLISKNQERIIATFLRTEIKERQRRTLLSPMKIDSLKERFGLSLKIPSAYRIASKSDEFYWIRKDLKNSGSTNIIIYETSLDAITNDSLALGEIIKIRDSIAGDLLPVEDEGRFITEEAYSPYLFKTKIDEIEAYETKGIWEIEGAFMAGPFINYAIKDIKNNRYLILEGFTYAPTVSKRNLQFELESILRSAKIN
jgi:hypothetical protein